jgi:hypothetical protein
MAKYKIGGTHAETWRPRWLTLTALGQQHAAEQAEAKGIRVATAHRLAEDPPTERQIAYARSLGIEYERATSLSHLSSLISINPTGQAGDTCARRHCPSDGDRYLARYREARTVCTDLSMV